MVNPCHFHGAPSFDFFTNFIRHCSTTKNIGAIKKAHSRLLRTGLFFICLDLQAKIAFTYASSIRKNNAQILTNFFKSMNRSNPLPFNEIISQFCRAGFHSLALQTFSFMRRNGVDTDSYALCTALSLSSSTQNLAYGVQLHALAAKSGWLCSVFTGSALIDLYAKSLCIDNADNLFDEMPVKNTVCVNALLSGYAESKKWISAIQLVRKIHGLNLTCDNFTLSAGLRSCAGLSAIEFGKQIHANAIRIIPNLVHDVFIQSLLIEMYGKCGFVEKAYQVFKLSGFGQQENQTKKDIVLWTSMLGVYGKNGNYKGVFGLYKQMLNAGIKPDGVAFVTLISACAHTGQLKLGLHYFDSMVHDFSLTPKQEHYGCLVDLFCKAGELEKAWKFMNEIDGFCSVSMWGALLSACSDNGEIELGKMAARRAIEIDFYNVGIYSLLSNMYAKYGMWGEIDELRKMMKEIGMKKDVGSSWIEVRS